MAMASPSDFLCWRKVQSCESVQRAGNLWNRKIRRCGTQFPSLLQAGMGTRLSVTNGTSWHHASLTCGYPQAHHCLVEEGNGSQQTLLSDFTPHSFAQTLWGPLQPRLGTLGCSAPTGCSLAQKAAWYQLPSASDFWVWTKLHINLRTWLYLQTASPVLVQAVRGRLILGRNCKFENQQQSFSSFGDLVYSEGSHSWTLNIGLYWIQISVQWIVLFFQNYLEIEIHLCSDLHLV